MTKHLRAWRETRSLWRNMATHGPSSSVQICTAHLDSGDAQPDDSENEEIILKPLLQLFSTRLKCGENHDDQVEKTASTETESITILLLLYSVENLRFHHMPYCRLHATKLLRGFLAFALSIPALRSQV